MPNNWPLVPLGRFIRQRVEFVRIDDLETYKRVRVQLHAKGIVLRDVVSGTEIKTKKQQVCRAGEFLVAEIDAKVGGVGIVPDDLAGAIVSSHYFLFEVAETAIDRRFLDFFIRTPSFQDQVCAQGSTNYAAIRPIDVLNYEIPLPPLDEQRRIVVRIEQLAAKIGEAQDIKQETGMAADLLFKNELSLKFNELSKRSQLKVFGDVCEVVRGGSPRPAGSPVFYGGSIPFLKVADITKDEATYLRTYTSTINQRGLSHSRYVEAETLLLTNSGATLGVPKICTFGTCFNDGIQAFLNLPESISKEYLYYYFRSKTQWFRDWAARGQGQPNLNTAMVKHLEFPLPSPPEQRRVVAYLGALQAKVDALKKLQAETAAELDALVPSILDKAFRGEL
jgi:type I restriction enzyme S subunit